MGSRNQSVQRRNRAALAPAVVVAALVAVAVAMFAAVTANASMITVDGTDNWTRGDANLGGTFDASGSDKLVFIATGEHGFNQTGNGWAGDVFYDGVQLTPAVKRQPIRANPDLGILVDDTYNALYYLDSPGSVHTAGVITTSGFSARGSVAVLALSNTLPGVGDTVVGARDTNTADLTTSAGSIVIGSYGMGGTGNTANPNTVTTPEWDAEVARQWNGGGRYWDGHVVAYQHNVSAGTRSYTFNDTYGPESDGRTGRHVIAAEFLAVPQAESSLRCQLGILDLSANGGINPATDEPWALGDQYRLVFISSTFVDPQAGPQMNDIATWNAAVQAIADNATTHDLSSVTWNIIGSTADVNARENTSTDPTVDGTGHAIFAMDGSSVIENNFVDLWDGNAPQNIALYDENVVPKGDSAAVDWPLTGTNWDGTAHGSWFLKDTSGGGTIRQGRNQEAFAAGWIDANRIGANWNSSSALSVYGMSEPLSVIPEPSSALLALLGLVGLLMVRRKR